MKRFAISCLCAGCALVFAACGGSSKHAAAPTTTLAAGEQTTSATTTAETPSFPKAVPQACQLVIKAQAETVMGTKLQDGTPVANPDINSCTYTGDPSGPTAQFEVYVSPGAKKFYDDDKNVLQHTFTNVPGLGDESHEEDFNIFFRKGANWVALRITSLDDWSTFKPRAEALAKDLAARI
jgi:hypothetical protein